MKIAHPSVELLTPVIGDVILCRLERFGRTCYKSEDRITDKSAAHFVRKLIASGHESVLEHCSLTVRIVCDRGVSHEIVRHRLASYSQESTRYCNYSKAGFGGEITVIAPLFLEPGSWVWEIWKNACEVAEGAYFNLLEYGCSPQEARGVLPDSLKTEVVMTANIREWRHFLKLRCAPAAHPQMREVATQVLELFRKQIPVCFDDITA